jgi:hypothetical protein
MIHGKPFHKENSMEETKNRADALSPNCAYQLADIVRQPRSSTPSRQGG